MRSTKLGAVAVPYEQAMRAVRARQKHHELVLTLDIPEEITNSAENLGKKLPQSTLTVKIKEATHALKAQAQAASNWEEMRESVGASARSMTQALHGAQEDATARPMFGGRC